MAKNLPKAKRLDVEVRAWDLAQRCVSQRRIADDLGVSQSTVSAALARVHARALKTLDADVARIKLTQTEQLAHLIDEAAQAWERSKRPKKKASKQTTTKGKSAGDGDGGERQTTEAQDRDGDVSFLYAVNAFMSSVRKIWGLDAVEKQDEGGRTFRDAVIEAEAADRDFDKRRGVGAAEGDREEVPG